MNATVMLTIFSIFLSVTAQDDKVLPSAYFDNDVINLEASTAKEIGTVQSSFGGIGGASGVVAPSVLWVRQESCLAGAVGPVTCSSLVDEGRERCGDKGVSAPYTLLEVDAVSKKVLSSQVRPGDCLGGEANESVEAFVFTEADFRSVALKGSGVFVQPENGEAIIKLPVFPSTSDEPQVLDTSVLGHDVKVRATPSLFRWDYGDGTVFETRDANRLYPDHSYAHEYVEVGVVSIGLTTTWTGEFSLDDGQTWIPVHGTATTTERSKPITVGERKPVLVNPTP